MLNAHFWKTLEDYDGEILGVFRDPSAARPVIDFLRRYGDGNIVADLGCGPGQSLPHLGAARAVFAVDGSAALLAQARAAAAGNGWDHVRFRHADLADYTLPERADVSLLSMSLFADGLHHAIRILDNVQRQTRPGGRVMLLVGALEALLYRFHLFYRDRFEQGESEEALQVRLRDSYNHFLTYGYFHQAAGEERGQIAKHWIKEELRDVLAGLRFRQIEIEKHLLPWHIYFPQHPQYASHEPTWFWRATMLNP